MHRVLVVEDDVLTAAVIRDLLVSVGHAVTVARTSAEAVAAFATGAFELVLLDRVLPDGDGHGVLAQIRRQSNVPVIILSARGGATEKVSGLDLGADDYITKPFADDELLARVRARLRRHAARPTAVRFGAVVADLSAGWVTVADAPAHLTPTELRLLEVLLDRNGATVRRDELIAVLSAEDATEQALQTHMSRLRRKLKEDGDRIKTAWGVGYRIET